jgi:hypothetical protein
MREKSFRVKKTRIYLGAERFPGNMKDDIIGDVALKDFPQRYLSSLVKS